jgi:hypothetical protein
MAAYEMVAATVGTSADWLRKFINGSQAKEPRWSVGWNLLDHYNRICTRVEQEIETERSTIQTLKREIDAVTTPVNRMVEIAQRAEAAATKGMMP